MLRGSREGVVKGAIMAWGPLWTRARARRARLTRLPRAPKHVAPADRTDIPHDASAGIRLGFQRRRRALSWRNIFQASVFCAASPSGPRGKGVVPAMLGTSPGPVLSGPLYNSWEPKLAPRLVILMTDGG